MLIHSLLGRIRWIAIALLVTSIGTARAEQRVWPPQVVDGYTVTLSMETISKWGQLRRQGC